MPEDLPTPSHGRLPLSPKSLRHRSRQSRGRYCVSSDELRWGAWLLTEMEMTDGLQQSFPLGQSLLLIPLALEGHTGAHPQGFAKVAIAG